MLDLTQLGRGRARHGEPGNVTKDLCFALPPICPFSYLFSFYSYSKRAKILPSILSPLELLKYTQLKQLHVP